MVDPYYDLAKLNHSFRYLYDSVVNNLYSIVYEEGQNLKFYIYQPDNYRIAINVFEKFLEDNLVDKYNLRLLTANLFLSMIPLHSEDKNKMIAFAIIGIMIFDDIDFNSLLIKIWIILLQQLEKVVDSLKMG